MLKAPSLIAIFLLCLGAGPRKIAIVGTSEHFYSNYLENYPKEKLFLDFYSKNSCAGRGIRVSAFEHKQKLPSAEGKGVEVRTFHIYAAINHNPDENCSTLEKPVLIKSVEIPPHPNNMTHLHLTYSVNLEVSTRH
jgi:hypothetical protein